MIGVMAKTKGQRSTQGPWLSDDGGDAFVMTVNACLELGGGVDEGSGGRALYTISC